MHLSRLAADALLLLATALWGLGFVFQKEAAAHVPPLLFVGLRFSLSALAALPLALWERKRQRRAREKTRLRRKDYQLAALIGLCLFAGAALQQTGIGTTSATNAGFLTCVYIALVPFAARLVMKTKLRPLLIFACGLSLLGAWLLAGASTLDHLGSGDTIILITAFLWAFHVVLIGTFMQRVDRPFFLTFVQFGITGFLALAAGLAVEPLNLSAIAQTWPSILYGGFVGGGIAYTLQLVGQRYAPPTEAALIFSMEGVFGALAAMLMLGERLTSLGLAGCGLIMAGVIMAETAPFWTRRPVPPPQS